MRPALAFLLLFTITLTAAFAVAPPGRWPPEVARWLEQLADDALDTRKQAMANLEKLGEDIVPVLRRHARTHPDVDVRLRAHAVAGNIEKKLEGEERQFTGHTAGPISFALSPDGKRMVSSSWEGGSERTARVWDVQTGKELFQITNDLNGSFATAWSKDGKIIATGNGWAVTLWDANNKGKLIIHLRGHRAIVYGLAFTPDSKKIVSCARERDVIVWDVATQKELRRLSDHGDIVRGIAVLPDGKHVMTACFDGLVRLFDLETGKLVRTFRGHTSAVWFVAVSGDGKRALSGGADRVGRVWDIESGKQVAQLIGHEGEIHGVALSRDGSRALTGSYDRSARLWNTSTGKVIQRLEGHTNIVLCTAFTGAEERKAITASYDRTLRLWNLRR